MKDDLRTVLTVSDAQMDDWREICKAFAKKVGAKLVFINNSSCGLEFENGTFKHVYISEMKEYLENS